MFGFWKITLLCMCIAQCIAQVPKQNWFGNIFWSRNLNQLEIQKVWALYTWTFHELTVHKYQNNAAIIDIWNTNGSILAGTKQTGWSFEGWGTYMCPSYSLVPYTFTLHDVTACVHQNNIAISSTTNPIYLEIFHAGNKEAVFLFDAQSPYIYIWPSYSLAVLQTHREYENK